VRRRGGRGRGGAVRPTGGVPPPLGGTGKRLGFEGGVPPAPRKPLRPRPLPPVPPRVSQPCPLPASRCAARTGGDHTGSGLQDPIGESGGDPQRSRRTWPAGAGSSPPRCLREGSAVGAVSGGAGTVPLQHDRVATQKLPDPVRAIARPSRRHTL